MHVLLWNELTLCFITELNIQHACLITLLMVSKTFSSSFKIQIKPYCGICSANA